MQNQSPDTHSLVNNIIGTKKMKRIIISLSFFLGTFQLFAQQDPTFGQYIFNSSIINPAQAGVQEANQIGVLARRQWVGMEGAPSTNSIYVNTRLQKNLGFAGGIYTDQVGPINTVTLQGDIASHIRLNDKWTMSAGIRLMGSNTKANLTTLPTNQSSDPNFSNNYNSGFNLNLGGGLLVYSERFFVGAAMPRLFSREMKDGNTTVLSIQNHLNIYGGANVKVSEDLMVTPSVLVRTTANAPMALDLNFMFNYKNTIDFGPMLRYNDAFGILVGYKISPNFYAGYMYEYPLSDIQMASKQTHEITLRMSWVSKYKTQVRSPRYFL